jgi:hypothetical protein
MTFIQIAEKDDADGFLALAKSGLPVSCLPKNTYGVQPQHLKILKRMKIPFKKIGAKHIRLKKSSLAA